MKFWLLFFALLGEIQHLTTELMDVSLLGVPVKFQQIRTFVFAKVDAYEQNIL